MRTKSTANRDHPPPKKHKTGTSSQATPSHNRTKFTSVEREERYNTLLQWTFIPERKVDLRRNEYPEFLTRLDQLKWGTIASPHDKFDPDVVREFYANAYPPEEGGGIGIDVARLMATEIYKTAVKGGKKGTMGFPSLITSLCARQGVTVNRTEPIKKPITKQYIKQNCKAKTAELQGQTSQQQQQQPQEQHQLTMEEKIMLHLEHLELQNDILRQGQLNQQQSFYTAYQRQYPEEQVFLSPEEFTGRFPWPGVRPTYPGETAGAAEPSGSGADEDENMS
ncbi:hypothetical protein Lal_00003166 [Lupinus albus]|nr:hypothetical protein Lal_00003166 [Lupinus albus]